MATFFPVLMLVFVLVRVHEIFPAFAAVSPVSLTIALSILFVGIDMATARVRAPANPQMKYLAIIAGWALLSTVPMMGLVPAISAIWGDIGMAALIFQIFAIAGNNPKRFSFVTASLIAMVTYVAVICVDMGTRPTQCVARVSMEESVGPNGGIPDGRPCDTAYSCVKDEGAIEGMDYSCVKVGKYNITSDGTRVRWVGTLADPNELSVFAGTIIPFILAFASMSEKKVAKFGLWSIVVLLLVLVVMTKSRGGQLVICTTFGIAFYERFGARGIMVAGVFAAPILALGGRKDDPTAAASTDERINLLRDGTNMVLHHPLFGVGLRRFSDETDIHLTAHNSYLLVAAELGIFASIVWLVMLFVSIKTAFLISRPYLFQTVDPRIKTLANAQFAALIGMSSGCFFLSYNWKSFVYVMFGLSAALYGMVKPYHPELDITPTKQELTRISGGYVVFLALLFLWSHHHG